MQVLVLYVLIIILFSLHNFECEEEDDYYDEYYDDEIVVDPKNGSKFHYYLSLQYNGIKNNLLK